MCAHCRVSLKILIFSWIEFVSDGHRLILVYFTAKFTVFLFPCIYKSTNMYTVGDAGNVGSEGEKGAKGDRGAPVGYSTTALVA